MAIDTRAYIADARAKGMSDDAIRSALLNMGVDKFEVDVLMPATSAVSQPQAAAPQTLKEAMIRATGGMPDSSSPAPSSSPAFGGMMNTGSPAQLGPVGGMNVGGQAAPMRIGFGRRLGAAALDAVIGLILIVVAVIVFLGSMLAALIGAASAGGAGEAGGSFLSGLLSALVGVISVIAAIALFYSLIEAFWGASVGKMIVGIRIANADGTKAGVGRLVFRWSLKNISYLLSWVVTAIGIGASGIVGTVIMLFGLAVFVGYFFVLGASKQALYDKIAKTAVFMRKDIITPPDYAATTGKKNALVATLVIVFLLAIGYLSFSRINPANLASISSLPGVTVRAPEAPAEDPDLAAAKTSFDNMLAFAKASDAVGFKQYIVSTDLAIVTGVDFKQFSGQQFVSEEKEGANVIITVIMPGGVTGSGPDAQTGLVFAKEDGIWKLSMSATLERLFSNPPPEQPAATSGPSVTRSVTITTDKPGGHNVTIKAGSDITISWTSQNVDLCVVSGYGPNTHSPGKIPTSGKYTIGNVQATGESLIDITCTWPNAGTNVSDKLYLTVVP